MTDSEQALSKRLKLMEMEIMLERKKNVAVRMKVEKNRIKTNADGGNGLVASGRAY